jgi:hypothetical protein
MNPTTSPPSETLVRGGRVPSADGTTISYLTRGSGPVILVIHGGLGSALSLQPLAGYLADEFEVAAMNCRGHGTHCPSPTPSPTPHSSKPPSPQAITNSYCWMRHPAAGASHQPNWPLCATTRYGCPRSPTHPLIPTMQVLSGLSPTVDQYTAVTTPTKLMVGTTSAPYILDAADLLADALPDLTREVLHGQNHHADHQLLARSLAAFVRR